MFKVLQISLLLNEKILDLIAKTGFLQVIENKKNLY